MKLCDIKIFEVYYFNDYNEREVIYRFLIKEVDEQKVQDLLQFLDRHNSMYRDDIEEDTDDIERFEKNTHLSLSDIDYFELSTLFDLLKVNNIEYHDAKLSDYEY